MQLQSGQVGQTLRQLEQRRLVERQHGARAERWGHRLDPELKLTAAQRVLIGLLLLRGPQTLNELWVRSERLYRFDDADDLTFQLDRLIQHGQAERLPKGPGQREPRYQERLTERSQGADMPAPAVDSAMDADTASSARLADLELQRRVDALEARVQALETKLAE